MEEKEKYLNVLMNTSADKRISDLKIVAIQKTASISHVILPNVSNIDICIPASSLLPTCDSDLYARTTPPTLSPAWDIDEGSYLSIIVKWGFI